MKSYQDREAWNDMTPLKTMEGKEMRVDRESGRFSYWRGDDLRRLKNLADIEREIFAAGRAVRVLLVRSLWGAVQAPEICDIVGRVENRWRYGTGALSPEYPTHYHYLWTVDLEARLRELAEKQAALDERFTQEQAELRAECNKVLENAALLTSERFAEIRKETNLK